MLGEHVVSIKLFLFVCFVGLTISLFTYFRSLVQNQSPQVVYCDVGQGDGTYVRTITGIDIIIDAGPDSSILTCLGKYMPIFDKTIEYAFLSHPQHDHYAGFIPMLANYRITTFYSSLGDNKAKSYTVLKKLLSQKGTTIKRIFAKDTIDIDLENRIDFLWPEKDFYSSDLNDYSQTFVLTLANKSFLFTGDASPRSLTLTKLRSWNNTIQIDVLKVPHHGSKNGLTEDFFKLANPRVSVISVAVHNRYKHPSPSIISMLKASKRPYFLTSEKGDISFTILPEELLPQFGHD
ncbi:hypothetical protein A3D80_02860 [Candidatus Roizmanbacteria bacterium RIFCSPHIGHO2_02_FULL_40_13b]|uniref:Metallo-beta-lactamase domain-containing protein n=1 Tax=Candidatus Roizmanbacteria bacterium RIFCSPHIGHO2_01_FULL_39_24 TaxID=1802032 RepID=A0A1F7GFB5_9BACT|nr:MAG: hypothetical protein A2799_02810 [Candidatus Roizmanbacteria bacterium RIFCSPHIGHO2_01_FULL_39_24]OGK27134.1 MAG: hypothetical protein A3D80_02860 [Candidatus Roizmanbacteria bacterium RIFCSPHIGHO2_02_FULL_40_13b]OGK57455.1 MAG: hypothetical protein A3H83_03285 [Candidatus Roizmanbacteria bacterium RIFCSPLOWO2_02_FULL_39_8]